MKKIIIIVSFALVFCLGFTSCNSYYFPSYSENFDKAFCESFLDNYFLADAALAYFKASPEVRIPNPYFPQKSIIIGEIENTNKSQFVSVIFNARFGAGDEGYVYIYQHKNTTNPMEDWNIESVTIVCGYIDSYTGDVFVEKSENYMDFCLSWCREIKTFKNETDSSFISGIQNAYLSASRDDKQKEVGKEQGNGWVKYYLLVKFKENSNIVWYTPLVISSNGFRICHTFDNYDEYSTYEGPNGHWEANKEATFSYEGLETRYGNLSEEITNELYEILVADGWDPEKNNPVPQTTSRTTSIFETPEYTNIPVDDIYPENN